MHEKIIAGQNENAKFLKPQDIIYSSGKNKCKRDSNENYFQFFFFKLF